MIVPDDKGKILRHLQGNWIKDIQYGGTVSFTIEGQHINNIQYDVCGIMDEDFTLEFNDQNLKWQLTSAIFGKDSVLINFEEMSFTILIRNGSDIVPPIEISEWYHTSVTFKKPKIK